ncbi:MAG TPA: energy transducer TonB [Thermoanaerobaculia bacterium]|nr:energy transducer TonB [Thermoanaerobaculia bacterium]HUM30756.1 energy transducer TonB [Thermoanaerobaculia bacterium]HXK69044.1 energy transducer TonB [Thermoanaerobaculia bacterium]
MVRNDLVNWESPKESLRLAITVAVAIHLLLFLIVFPTSHSTHPIRVPIPVPPSVLSQYQPPPPPEESNPVQQIDHRAAWSIIPTVENPGLRDPDLPVPQPIIEEDVRATSEIPIIFPPTPPSIPDTVIRIPGVDAPKAIYQPYPAFPSTALNLGKGGMVIARLTLNTEGFVEEVKVLRTEKGLLGHILEAAVRDTLATWIYEPTTVEGNPVKVQMVVTVMFNLNR